MSEPRIRKSVLITGGAGFIGSHLAEHLLANGHTVRVVDNFIVGKTRNLEAISNDPRLEIYQHNIEDFEAISPLFAGIEWVFHLAARADIVPSIESPIEYHQANVNGTISVLEAARRAGVKRFIYAASSSCYGIPDFYPTPETAPARPMYPYALTKYLAEEYVMNWYKFYGLATISLRLFNVFGPRHRTSGTYGAVFGVFLAQKLAGEPFTVVGDGEQTRDFTFVTDVCQAFEKAANTNICGEIFNVGSRGTYSVNRLVELLGGNKIFIPKRPGEPDRTFADISKITDQLNWSPKVSFEEGISIMLENIDYWQDAPIWTQDKIKTVTASWFNYLGKKD